MTTLIKYSPIALALLIQTTCGPSASKPDIIGYCQNLSLNTLTPSQIKKIEQYHEELDAWPATEYLALMYRAAILNPSYLTNLKSSNDPRRIRLYEDLKANGYNAYATFITSGYKDEKMDAVLQKQKTTEF
jgi:hypothetical protein